MSIESLKAAKAAYDSIIADLSQNIGAKLQASLAELSGIDAIHWRQYTPYFNDGEPCVFSIYGVDMKVAGAPKDPDLDEEDERFAKEYQPWTDMGWKPDRYEWAKDSKWRWETDYLAEPQWVAAAELASLIHSDTMLPVLLAAFGDHAEITVTADSITVDEYDHD